MLPPGMDPAGDVGKKDCLAMSRTALYPGTFDPLTNGHLDIIGRAVKLVDKLIIGVAINEAKRPLFSLEERVQIVEQEVAHLAENAEIEVRPFDGLLMHFAEQVGAQSIMRGLRAVSDFEYEFQMVAMNQQLNDEIETVFLMADPRHQAIASRLVKEIAALGGDVSAFVPPRIESRLKERFA
nr:pantetheine-phosphate adenylyltransferase [Maricaulis sp.]